MKQNHEAEILEHALSARELCEVCQVEETWLREFISHGSLHEHSTELYSATSIVRVRKAKRLERDLNLNVSGIALVLDLLDEIEKLKTQVHRPS